MAQRLNRFVDRKREPHPNDEIAIGRCIFSKRDIQVMYIDQGVGIEEMAKRIGVGRRRANHILDRFSIPKSWKSELTPRRLRVLQFIRRYQKKYHQSPLLIEISNGLGISNVHYHLTQLKKHGYIDWDHKHRSIQILKMR
ncbi:hypothetical protein GCM10011391_28230 [Pullulanibacillus camelliae]|uniref:LexA repressor DNA-binding domain-containing protein n=1 Tax=Pullulanibacillus camelliae TaxID=1707096 RepID=A0A8J3DX80_9BACL|nr:hypothetical protein [Pullulanibacillus camelliae]GGE47835.1 hypothetical protein GCM10011391_28230 [Pullulanibacillus camelliae]